MEGILAALRLLSEEDLLKLKEEIDCELKKKGLKVRTSLSSKLNTQTTRARAFRMPPASRAGTQQRGSL